VLDTGFAPCYTVSMVQWNSDAWDCKVGDIIVESIKGQDPSYWVVSKVKLNDNPIRYGHTYKKMYDVFNLGNDMNCLYNVMFRDSDTITYRIIRGQ